MFEQSNFKVTKGQFTIHIFTVSVFNGVLIISDTETISGSILKNMTE